MFGFQRVGDLIWQAADARGRGFLLGATAGRTTLLGEGLQHQDGHSLVLASTVPPCQAYDPAFAYEVAAIVQDGLQPDVRPDDAGEDVFYYLTLYNENYAMPPMPDGRAATTEIVEGLYRFAAGAGRARRTGDDARSPARPCSRPPGRRRRSPSTTTSAPSCGRRPLQAAARGGAGGRALEPPAPRPSRRARRS